MNYSITSRNSCSDTYEPLAFSDAPFSSDKWLYQLTDHLMTPMKMADCGQNIVWSAEYKVFGEVEIDPTSTVVNNIRFPGQYWDEESGLHYNYFRYYSPNFGRYYRYDDFSFSLAILLDQNEKMLINALKYKFFFDNHNLYIYSNNNSIYNTDYYGLISLGCVICKALTILSCESFLLPNCIVVAFAGPAGVISCFTIQVTVCTVLTIKADLCKNECEDSVCDTVTE